MRGLTKYLHGSSRGAVRKHGAAHTTGYVLDPVDPDDAELLRYGEHTLFQTQAWLRFVTATQGATPVVARLRDGDRVIGRFTGLTVRRHGLRLLGAPLPGWSTAYMGFALEPEASRPEAYRALRRYAFDELGCVHLEVSDRHASRTDLAAAGLRFDDKTMSGYQVDLAQGPDAVFANMTRTTRSNVRRAERDGVQVEIAQDAAFADDFYAQLKDVFAKQRLVPTYPVERVRSLIEHLQPTGRLLLLRARDPDGRPIATGIFPAANGTMYFWGGASWREHQKLKPNEALQWTAMRYWMERGMTVYDMMGGSRYKRNYGAVAIHVPRGRASRFAALEHLRNLRKRAHGTARRIAGARRR